MYKTCKNWADKCLQIVEQQKSTNTLKVAETIVEYQPEIDVVKAYGIAAQTLSILFRTKKINAKRVGKGYVYSVKIKRAVEAAL